MKSIIDEIDVSGAELVSVVGRGSLSDIIKKHYRNDLATRKEVFDTEEQQQAVFGKVEQEIKDHPELVHQVVRYAVADMQGQSATAGFKELRESVQEGQLLQSKLALALQSTKTLKIESGKHVPLAYATASDIFKVYERQQDEADKIVHQSGETKRSFAVIIDAMRASSSKTLGELAFSFGE
jgi:hypothetical protein